jgi:hypothetical protein
MGSGQSARVADRGLSFFAAPEESEAWLHFCGELGWRVARIERGKLTSIYIGEEDVEDSLLVNAPGRYGYVQLDPPRLDGGVRPRTRAPSLASARRTRHRDPSP